MLRATRPFLGAVPRISAPKRGSVASLTFLASSRTPSVSPRAGVSPLSAPVLALVQRSRYATVPPNRIDKEAEKKLAQQKIDAPTEVSTESSVRHVFEESQNPAVRADQDVTKDLKQDIANVTDTFALKSVPPLSYALGLAGTVPYLATSLATVYLGWDLNRDYPTGSAVTNSFLMSHESAQQWMQILEPIQLGYGAVIISFLGAIHWGLEYAERKPLPERTRFRYATGVLAPIVAWPTLLMPSHFALISQFAAFVALYFADTRATYRGWAPAWYGTYRFVLTFITGGAILISLIGREKIGADRPRLDNMREKLQASAGAEPYSKWAKKEEEEKERIKKEKEEEEKRKKEEEKKRKEDEEKKNKSGDKSKKGSKDDKENKGKKDEKKSDDNKKDEKENKENKDEKKEDMSDDSKKDESKGGDNK